MLLDKSLPLIGRDTQTHIKNGRGFARSTSYYTEYSICKKLQEKVRRQFSLGHRFLHVMRARHSMLPSFVFSECPFKEVYIVTILGRQRCLPPVQRVGLPTTLEASVFLQSKGMMCFSAIIKNWGSLSSRLLSCNTTYCIHLGPSVLLLWDLGTRTTDKNMLIHMVLAVPYLIKSSVSDPAVSYLLSASMKF